LYVSLEMVLIIAYRSSIQSPPRRPLQENRYISHMKILILSINRPDMPRYQNASVPCASYPPPQHYEYVNEATSENTTINIPPLPQIKSPTRLQLTAPSFLTPHRRRTTLGSPSRQNNPTLSPVKSHTNLHAAANMDAISRKHMSTVLAKGDKAGGMIKVAARNTFRGRETETVDWDKECELAPEGEMPSPFIRRRGVSRISAGLPRN
jgi:hypothetical protein